MCLVLPQPGQCGAQGKKTCISRETEELPASKVRSKWNNAYAQLLPQHFLSLSSVFSQSFLRGPAPFPQSFLRKSIYGGFLNRVCRHVNNCVAHVCRTFLTVISFLWCEKRGDTSHHTVRTDQVLERRLGICPVSVSQT